MLFNDNINSTDYTFDERIIYHLSIDKVLADLCPNTHEREYFLDILRRKTSLKEIDLRRDIISDFLVNPTLYNETYSLFDRFNELYDTYKQIKRETFQINVISSMSIITANNILRSQAVCCKRAFMFIKGFADLFSNFQVKSPGLNLLKEECLKISTSPDFNRILSYCSEFEDFSTAGTLNYKITLDGNGKLATFSYIEDKYVNITDPNAKKKKSFFARKDANDEGIPCERISDGNNDFYTKYSIAALSDFSKLFANVSEQIFERFLSIREELSFYRTAMRYVRFLTEHKIPFCFPSFSENANIEAEDLYDLNLLLTHNGLSGVYPNDIRFIENKSGILIFGENGSGKTVFLRSVGTMQIFAQAGLPIAAKSGKSALCSQVVTQFSEAEKYFDEGNEAGRFEQEVREISDMVDNLKPGAMVFLNETFQSTSYEEGASGLADILDYFSRNRIRWILVSHLKQLLNHFSDNEVSLIRTEEMGYMRSKAK